MALSGKIHGRFAVALLGGYDVSNDTTSVEYSTATQMAKSTGMGGVNDDSFTIGQNDNKITLKGWFDDAAAAGLYTALNALRDTSFVATFLPAGDGAQGYSALMGNTQVPSDIKVASPIGGTVTVDGNFQISGQLDFGVVHLPRTVVTGTGAQATTTAIDNGVSSALGAQAHFHVTVAPSGGGTLSSLILQHSSDNITYNTLLTSSFAGTGIGADRQATAATTTVQRYTRVVYTLTNAQTATIAVAFKRN